MFCAASFVNTVQPQWLEHLWDHGSSSHWGLIMAPVQKTNSDNLGKSFQFSTQWLYVECTHLNCLDEAILMSTHNIQFHDKIRKKIPKYLFSWAIGRILYGLKKKVRIIHGKRAIRVRAIEVILYNDYLVYSPQIFRQAGLIRNSLIKASIMLAIPSQHLTHY